MDNNLGIIFVVSVERYWMRELTKECRRSFHQSRFGRNEIHCNVVCVSHQSAVVMQGDVVTKNGVDFVQKSFGKGVMTSRCSEAELKKSHSS